MGEGEEEGHDVNPPAWWSEPWWRWVLTIIFAAVVAGLLVPTIRNVLLWIWNEVVPGSSGRVHYEVDGGQAQLWAQVWLVCDAFGRAQNLREVPSS